MANEAVKITLLGNAGDPVTYTVAAGTAIAKGTLMYISASPKTALATNGVSQAFCGIASVEKTTTDGVTELALWTHGLFDMTCGAAESMVLGAPVKTGAAANEVDVATADTIASARNAIGVAQETVAGNGTGAVLINVGRTR